MRFAIGAEVDNDPRARPDAQNIVEALRPDGIIRYACISSTSRIRRKGPIGPGPSTARSLRRCTRWWRAKRSGNCTPQSSLTTCEKLPAHIAGHFYVRSTLGKWPQSENCSKGTRIDCSKICHRRGIAVEINTRFLYRDHSEESKKKYLDANARLIRKAKARGVGIAIGSDAHSPTRSGQRASTQS